LSSEGCPSGDGQAAIRLDIFTLFPEAFDWFLGQRHVANLLERGTEIRLINYRDTSPLGAGQVDDAPYGGGAGMVLRVDVVDAALRSAYGDRPHGARVVLLSPAGRLLDEELAVELARERHVALLCGRYEGVDERVRERLVSDSVSIGRYVISGGELAAMVVAEYPHYTRPASYRGWEVPDVLLSGHHARIREWRLERSRESANRRPDVR
jgi:tRNA (guanine37-N1)-methyltransferase